MTLNKRQKEVLRIQKEVLARHIIGNYDEDQDEEED